MKKILLCVACICAFVTTQAQVFNSDVNLQKGGWLLGVEPVVLVSNTDFMFFVHGGYGIKSAINLDLKGGFGNGGYFGADLKWGLFRHISLSTGILYDGRINAMGVNGCLNIGIPIRSDIRIITGAHLNVDFADKLQTPFWIPVGVDIGLKKYMGLVLEGEIGIGDAARGRSLIGGGLAFYF